MFPKDQHGYSNRAKTLIWRQFQAVVADDPALGKMLICNFHAHMGRDCMLTKAQKIVLMKQALDEASALAVEKGATLVFAGDWNLDGQTVRKEVLVGDRQGMTAKHGSADNRDFVVIQPLEDRVRVVHQNRTVSNITADPQHSDGAVTLRIGVAARPEDTQVIVGPKPPDFPPPNHPKPTRKPRLYPNAPWNKEEATASAPSKSDELVENTAAYPSAIGEEADGGESKSGELRENTAAYRNAIGEEADGEERGSVILPLDALREDGVKRASGVDARLAGLAADHPIELAWTPDAVMREERDEAMRKCTSKVIGSMWDNHMKENVIDLKAMAHAAVSLGSDGTMMEVLAETADHGERIGGNIMLHAQATATQLTEVEDEDTWDPEASANQNPQEEADFGVDDDDDADNDADNDGEDGGAETEDTVMRSGTGAEQAPPHTRAPDDKFNFRRLEPDWGRYEMGTRLFSGAKFSRFQGCIGINTLYKSMGEWRAVIDSIIVINY